MPCKSKILKKISKCKNTVMNILYINTIHVGFNVCNTILYVLKIINLQFVYLHSSDIFT